MKQEFVTVGRWTLRCDDVSGVRVGNDRTDTGHCVWTVGLATRSGPIRVRVESEDEARRLERRVQDAIGYTGNPPGGVGVSP
jgi:hypothetical protein